MNVNFDGEGRPTCLPVVQRGAACNDNSQLAWLNGEEHLVKALATDGEGQAAVMHGNFDSEGACPVHPDREIEPATELV